MSLSRERDAVESRTENDLAVLTLAEIAAKLREHETTSVELTESCLDRIEAYDTQLHACISVCKSEAIAAAKRADAEIEAGKYRGPLHGIPIAAKDNIDTAGIATTGGSLLFEGRIPSEDATVIHRLKDAGAVLIAKTNLQEFALGASNSSPWGPVGNPRDPSHYSGGSSSGSGAAIAAGFCYGALGTDTGGSVRIPASYCGVVGFKATYGLVPIRGIIPGILSLDHCGPLTRSVEDAAIMLNTLAGHDALDITSVNSEPNDYVIGMQQPVSQLQLGIAVDQFDGLQPDVEKAAMSTIRVLTSMTKAMKEIKLPPVGDLSSLDAETWAWHEEHFRTLADKYTVPVRRRMSTLAATHFKAADYVRCIWRVQELRRTIKDCFREVDLVVLPTTRVVAPTIEELRERDAAVPPADSVMDYPNCILFNVYGLPAISVPCGFSESGLPIGLTIAGPHFSESRVLALANAYEKAADWHKRRPELKLSR